MNTENLEKALDNFFNSNSTEPEEANNYRGDFKTAGRKGVKMQRMNLAIKPELYEYVRTICRITGRTYAEFVNAVLEKHLQEHGDLYQQALEMRDKLF